MKHISLYNIALFLSFTFSAYTQKQNLPFTLSSIPKPIKTKLSVQSALESPNGNFIYYTDTKLSTVYIKNLKSPNAEDVLVYSGINCGYFAAWSTTGTSIYMRNKYKSGGKSTLQSLEYNVTTKQTKVKTDLLPQSIVSAYIDESYIKNQVYINTKLQLVKLDANKHEIILEKDQQCYQPIVSPNKKMVAVHIGSQIWIYDMAGKNKPYSLGMGLVNSWSPDSKYLVGHIDTSVDGHQLSGSDLYLYDVITAASYKLTNTKDIYEINPSFSATGLGIYYVNAKTETLFYDSINKHN